MARKSVTITLYESELIYEVQNKTSLTGKSRDDGKNFEQVSHMKASEDDESRNQILRSIGNAAALLKTKLDEYVTSSATSANNAQLTGAAGETIVFNLSMPENYNLAMNEAVTAGMHQYIVNRCMVDWFVMTNKADAKEYAELAAQNIIDIREAINKRVRPTRVAPSVN